MKLIFFNYKLNSKKRNKIQKLNIERLLFLSCIIVFVLMLLVQAALTSPSVRTFLNGSSSLEGIPLETEEYMFAEGKLGLKLINCQRNYSLKVLINGEDIQAFDENIVNLKVRNGDVVEIDGSGTSEENEVEIVSKDENIISDCLGKKVSVNGNVKQLIKIKVKDE